MSITSNILGLLRKVKKKHSWMEIEYFDEEWKNRIEKMASLIDDNEHLILDIGCGQQWLKSFLSKEKTYYGCDYKYRDQNTIICDLNKKEFPSLNVDVCFISGCLEYVVNVDWFINTICKCCKSIIISYCPTDSFPNKLNRMELAWVNHMSVLELEKKILLYNFTEDKRFNLNDGTVIFKFKSNMI